MSQNQKKKFFKGQSISLSTKETQRSNQSELKEGKGKNVITTEPLRILKKSTTTLSSRKNTNKPILTTMDISHTKSPLLGIFSN